MAGGSTILFREYFDSGVEGFLPSLLDCDASGVLRRFADKWVQDRRPFARGALLAFIDDGCDRLGHRGLVKALYKHFEANEDDPAADEVMAHFLVAFDRLPVRRLVKRGRWDRAAGQYVVRSELKPGGHVARDHQRTELKKAFDRKAPFKGVYHLSQFTLRTRQHLKRRAWRWFRKLARQSPERCGLALATALKLYRDEHLTKTSQLLDAWGLVHTLYWGSPVLNRQANGIRIAQGHKLAELKPAPFLPALWRGCRDLLVDILQHAASRTVRLWARDWLKAEYAIDVKSIPVERLRTLLGSSHEEVQLFAAELLQETPGLESLPLVEWMALLRIQNPAVVGLIASLVEKNVTPARLTLAQCVELACGPVAPVAELGLKWAKTKPLRGGVDLQVLTQLARAPAATVRAEASEWLCELLEKSDKARPENVRELIDSRHEDMRAPALALFRKSPAFRDSLMLWAALSESPHADVRAVLIEYLGEREKAYPPEALRAVWATTLLGVARGGRTKQLVLNRVAQRISRHPSEADALIPLFAIALRSVQVPERRGALAAVASAAARRPSLKAALRTKLPELVLHEGLPA